MNLILSLPMEVRLAVVFLLGACIGSAANWAIYRLAWNRRPIGPWSPPDAAAPPRRPADRLPILGWLGLRREAPCTAPASGSGPCSWNCWPASA